MKTRPSDPGARRARRGFTVIATAPGLKLILRGKRVGFSLAEIKEILDLYNLRGRQVTQLQVSLEKGREKITELEHQRRDIDEAIADLSRTCEIIDVC